MLVRLHATVILLLLAPKLPNDPRIMQDFAVDAIASYSSSLQAMASQTITGY
jgi:hypothetical protein